MASIRTVTDTDGGIVYKISASSGRGRRVTRSWRPEDGWSARTIERELNKFAATLENDLAAGTVETIAERTEREQHEALEAAKIKTLRQYAIGVFMPAKTMSSAEGTRRSYQSLLDLHILPALGDFPLEDITPAMITRFLFTMQSGSLHHATVTKIYAVLSGLFKMALLDDSIDINPMQKVERPKPRKDEPQKPEQEKAFTAKELQHILQCLQGEPLKWRLYVSLLAKTGIRRGEACGLQWQDIDFTGHTITVQHNLQYTAEKGVYMATPKNGKSRVIDIGDELSRSLRELQRIQAADHVSKFVFSQPGSAEPMHPTSPTHYFASFGKRYGIKDFHPHKLRHTAASLAITNGADVVSVSQRLGHSDTSVTLRMYAHANEDSVRRAGDILREAIGQS